MKIKFNTDENTYISTEVIHTIENLCAIGILTHVCSYPDNFVFNKEDLRSQCNMKKSQFYEAIDYLLSMGYIENQNQGYFILINE